jgi:3-phosphoshikimate 1-carboxyvinyltransferase
MNVKIQIPYLNGKWRAPASKSELIRYIALAMRCEEQCIIKNISLCNDSYGMIKIAENWGAEINLENESLIIQGQIFPVSNEYNAGESALCLRLMTPILSSYDGTFYLNAEGSLLKRPVGEIETILNQIGAKITTTKGLPPVNIQGIIKPTSITIEFPLSSQNISGLLMTLPFLNGKSRLLIKKLVSLPYIKVTIKCLEKAGITIITNDKFDEYYIEGNQKIKPFSESVEGDWSAASIIIAGSALYGNVTLNNLNNKSLQADKEIVNFVSIKNNKVSSQSIKAFEANITHCPDLFPALVVLAMHANDKCTIYGLNRLIHKESNRIESFLQEFSKFGVKFDLLGDKVVIKPTKKVDNCIIETHNDHRIAMAAAIAITGTKASIIIKDAQCVNKSYPSFWEDLKCLGAKIEFM